MNVSFSSSSNQDLTFFEQEAKKTGYSHIVGIDEAGRGPLAGPVVAAAVFFPKHPYGLPIDDSKRLSEKQREFLFNKLINSPDIQYGIGIVSAKEIDKINILNATHLAMRMALEQIPQADFALIDGLPIKGMTLPYQAIVKGDHLSESIAAASIIAKVWRDHYMLEVDKKWPMYRFVDHKGYGTRVHLTALQEHGPCPEHRQSFAPIKAILNQEQNKHQLTFGL